MQICDSNILLKDQDAIFGALLNFDFDRLVRDSAIR